MTRVVGTDPGTSSLDLLLLADGLVEDQARLDPDTLRADPSVLVRTLRAWEPLDLIAGPSGYGLPLVRIEDLDDDAIDRMALTRPEERGQAVGVVGFRSWVRSLVGSGLPIVFLPGGIHLPSIPPHRKVNAVDLGTADKVAVAFLALAARSDGDRPLPAFAVVEVGTAFTSVLVLQDGQLADARAGSRGPIGLHCGGAWDGEVAYWLSPLRKDDLFRGGVRDLGSELGPPAFRESLRQAVAGLKSVTPFDLIYVSGAGLDRPDVAAWVREALEPLGDIVPLPTLPGAWVKHAAQGAALIADGLVGGSFARLVETMGLRRAVGDVLDHLRIR